MIYDKDPTKYSSLLPNHYYMRKLIYKDMINGKLFTLSEEWLVQILNNRDNHKYEDFIDFLKSLKFNHITDVNSLIVFKILFKFLKIFNKVVDSKYKKVKISSDYILNKFVSYSNNYFQVLDHIYKKDFPSDMLYPVKQSRIIYLN